MGAAGEEAAAGEEVVVEEAEVEVEQPWGEAVEAVGEEEEEEEGPRSWCCMDSCISRQAL